MWRFKRFRSFQKGKYHLHDLMPSACNTVDSSVKLICSAYPKKLNRDLSYLFFFFIEELGLRKTMR